MDDDAPGTRPGPDEVSLLDAARQLGMSAEALRKRVQRGKTLRGRKWRGEWYIHRADVEAELDAAGRSDERWQDAIDDGPSEPVRTEQDAPPHAEPGPDQPRPDAGWTRADMLERELSLTRELLDVERRRADEATAANAELRRLLALALQDRPALPAPGGARTEPDAAGREPEPPARHVRTRPRRRLDILRQLVRELLGV